MKLNVIGNEIKVCSSLGIFKRNILALIRPTSKHIFGIDDSFGLKYPFQLQVGLSPIKSQKKYTILLILQLTVPRRLKARKGDGGSDSIDEVCR